MKDHGILGVTDPVINFVLRVARDDGISDDSYGDSIKTYPVTFARFGSVANLFGNGIDIVPPNEF